MKKSSGFCLPLRFLAYKKAKWLQLQATCCRRRRRRHLILIMYPIHLPRKGKQKAARLHLYRTETIIPSYSCIWGSMKRNVWSSPETPNCLVVMEGLFPINHALDVPKLLHMARYGYGSLLIKPVFFLCLLQELQEQWVVEVYHRHHKSLLLLTLAHLDCQTSLRHISDILLLSMVMVMKMRQV